VATTSQQKINCPLMGSRQGYEILFQIVDSLLSVEEITLDILNLIRKWIVASTSEGNMNCRLRWRGCVHIIH